MKTANAKTLRAQGLSVRKLVLTAMLGALGFVLSTFVYFPSMAPFQHFCNVLGAVFLLGKTAAVYAYIGPFLVSTAGGAIIAGAVLFALKRSGGLNAMQAVMEH